MPDVRLLTVTSPVLSARCTLVVADDGDTVVVDAGAGVCGAVVAAVQQHGLVVHAVLATHGHADHVWDARPLAEALGVPVVLHAADRYRLDDPFGSLGVLGDAAGRPQGPLAQALAAAGVDPEGYRAPGRVQTFGTVEPGRDDDVDLTFGSLRLKARHAPGHTQGSTLYLLDDDPPVVLTGDVLFAGSIGRTDLPGGDSTAMARTLREAVGALPADAIVVPGHGPTSTVARERATNPYLGGI